MKRKWTTTLLILLMSAATAYSQTTYNLSDESELSVEGTSNVRDWDGVASDLSGTLQLTRIPQSLDDLEATDLQSLSIEIPVKSIENDNGKLTSNMHKYLKEKEQPVITFKLTGVDELVINGSSASITSRGDVSVAGVTLPVTMSSELAILPDGVIQVTGIQELKMTDFGIDPPTAMFGAIRAVDEVQVHYSVQFQQ